MIERDVTVIFEAEYELTLEEPYDSAVVRQALQDALGHTGLLVLDVLIADGATDL
jgi:hypothetical protein